LRREAKGAGLEAKGKRSAGLKDHFAPVEQQCSSRCGFGVIE
jgi:hypothetical protein